VSGLGESEKKIRTEIEVLEAEITELESSVAVKLITRKELKGSYSALIQEVESLKVKKINLDEKVMLLESEIANFSTEGGN
jgi:chromosome segregation ATPase